VVNCKVPASGAFVALVKAGPDEMVKAWEQIETLTIARKADQRCSRRTDKHFKSLCTTVQTPFLSNGLHIADFFYSD
jgi:hypothetical protein